MGVFSSALKREVRLERMRPGQLAKAMAERAAVYVPFGSIEWHGRHNAVGLDAIKAHEQLVGLAVRLGGVVYPPVFFGSGGGHSGYANSYMVDPAPMQSIVAQLLRHFERDGFAAAILLSGHYPNRTEYLDAPVADYQAAGGTMRVLALVENQLPHGTGDHAAKVETSFMMHLHPETVDLTQLAGRDDDIGAPDQRHNWMTEVGPDHPCYGIVGIDPRAHASAEFGRAATENVIEHLAAWLDGAWDGQAPQR